MGHLRIFGLQYGNCVMSQYWRLEFGGGFKGFGKLVDS